MGPRQMVPRVSLKIDQRLPPTRSTTNALQAGKKSTNVCPALGSMQTVPKAGNEIDKQKLTTDFPPPGSLRMVYIGRSHLQNQNIPAASLRKKYISLPSPHHIAPKKQMRSQTSIALRNACYRMTQTSATHGGPMPGASEDQARLVRGPSGPVHGPGGPY